MATKAKVIRNFFKKFFDIDAKGMSEVAVVRDVLKKKYNVDANGGSVVSLLQDVIENNESIVEPDGGGGDDSFLIVPSGIWTGECEKTYGIVHRVITGNGCVLGEFFDNGIIGGFRINGRWFDGQEIACKYGNNEMGIQIEGFELSYSENDGILAQKSIDCDDPAYDHGQTITPTVTVTWEGNTYSAQLPLQIIAMGG